MSDFKFKKQYGQNFISDTNLLKAIVNDAEITKEDEILEIGVGFGSLTKFLCEASKKVVCYEIDESLDEKIRENLNDKTNYEINYKDILKAQNEEISQKFDGCFKIVANLPYYITTPIIFKFLESELNIDSLTIMIQKEVGERICSMESCKDYGILSVMIQTFADVKITRIVNRNMFYPTPNVDSCVVNIKINKKKYNIMDKIKYRNFIQSCFSMRRKTLYNNLKSYFNSDDILNALNKLNLSVSVRSENLTIKNFVDLFNLLTENK